MAYTKDGRYYNEETHHLSGAYESIVSRKKPRPIKENFILNIRINEEVLKKFSDYCQERKLKKSKVLKKFIIDVVDNDLSLKKFEKFNNPFLRNDKNMAVKINKELYDEFVKVCHEKSYKEVSSVLRSFVIYAYSQESEEVS